ncbi:coiled-coil domain-containing protein 18 isoform X1 [Salmo trutta]|uniref:coiled-coil domain-containing protein 18 isoform X1 n=1 Tax=Salmo trutta TaxID=8032 RepID=UPI00112FDF75|nr:coiled-coil domain-containing protein 18-like isoform X1 [Salmo trutta]
MAEERRVCSSASQIESTPPSSSSSMRELESKNLHLRRKLSSVEEESASVMQENRQLIIELEAVNLELASSKTKVRVLGSTVGSKTSSVCHMKEEIEVMEAEVEAQGNALRDTEKRLEETEETLVIKSRLVDQLQEELMATRAELENRTNQGIRVEQQRKEALVTAERQTLALQSYKGNMSEKLKKVLDNEARLKEALIQCDKERVVWERRCLQLEQDKTDMNQLIGQLKEESVRAKAMSVESATLRSRLEEASIQAVELKRRLSDREIVEKDIEVLRKECGDLRHLTTSQEQRLEHCQREAQQSQAEQASLEAILSLLYLRESGGGSLCAKPCLPAPVCDVPKLKPGEQYQQLLPVLRAVEQERVTQAALALDLQERLRQTQEEMTALQNNMNQRDLQLQKLHTELQERTVQINQLEREAALVLGLQERLRRAQEEMTALQNNMNQRDLQLQKLHTELQERTVQINQLERELRRKNVCLATTEQQLEKKDAGLSQAVEKTTELELNLLEKSTSIQHFKTTLDLKKRDFQQELEETQRVGSEQRKALQDQIKMLHSQKAKLEKDFSSSQHERQEAQHRAERLQTSLNQLTHDTETRANQDQEALRALRVQATEYTTKVRFLETALTTCQDELSDCMQQIKGVKGRYERELETSAKEVEALQAEMRGSSLVCQSSSEQNLQLQHTVQRQQTMLQESTSRVAELEDRQALLLEQVGRLEKDLEKEKVLAFKELKRRDHRAQEAIEGLQEASQQAARREREALQLSNSVTQLSEDMNKVQGELSEREQQMLLIRRESDTKALQLSKMEKMLAETRGKLDKKTESGTESKGRGNRDNMVQDLEEKVRFTRKDRRNSLHRTQLLESQMKTVKGELVDTLDHLQELRDRLRCSQANAEQRKVAMEKLQAGMRVIHCQLEETCRELEQKKQEITDKDTEIKERQEELELKSLQLSKLEAAVESRTQKMQQKLILQQGTLEISQREAKERTNQVEFLSERLELIQKQLQGKEDLEKEALVQGQQLFLCREKLQRTSHNQEMHSRCEILTIQLEESVQLCREKENHARHMEEEQGRMEEQAAQTEARLQATVASLRLELDTLRWLQQNELSALQESQAEVLKASECVVSTLRCSQVQLTSELQHYRLQLEEAQHNTTALLAELNTREQLLQSTSETLLIKESEMTRLRTKISSFERSKELHKIAVCSCLTSIRSQPYSPLPTPTTK